MKVLLNSKKWERDEDATLLMMWKDGKTATHIARVMDRSKNSIISRAHRIGCAPRPSPLGRKKIEPRPAKTGVFP